MNGKIRPKTVRNIKSKMKKDSMRVKKKEKVAPPVQEIPSEEYSLISGMTMNNLQMVQVSGKPYYKIMAGDEKFYVSQTKKVYRSEGEILKDLGVTHSEHAVSTIEDVLTSCNSSSGDLSVIHEIKKILKDYVYLKTDEEYTLIAFYIILTYSYQIFTRIPYLSLRGEQGSGKSTLMLIMKALSHRPRLFSNITPASLFRIIDQEKPSLFLDEAESLTKRSSSNSPIFQILNSGYNAEGKVARVEMGATVQYSVYCPKVIAGINSLHPTTEDRCIVIWMEKAPSHRKPNPLVDVSSLQLLAGEVIRKVYTELNLASPQIVDYYKHPSLLKLSSVIKNRDLDRWLPLLALAKAFSTPKYNYFKEMVDLALDEVRKKNEAEANLPENSCKRLIIEFIKANKDIELSDAAAQKIPKKDRMFYYVSAEEFFYYVSLKDVYNSYSGQGEVTKALGRASIRSARQRFKSQPVIIYKVPVSMVN